MLTKKALKLGLMRAKNSIEYANYYYLLEQVTGLYYEYLDKYNAKLLTIKDDKIDRLQATVDDQTARINQLLSRTDHIIEQNDDLLIDNQYLNDKVDELKDDVEGKSKTHLEILWKIVIQDLKKHHFNITLSC